MRKKRLLAWLVLVLCLPVLVVLGARRLTPAEFQAKQAKRLKASTEEIRAGVVAVTEAPSARAIAKKDKMLANLTASVEDGTWERRLGAHTLSDWKRDMTDKGIGRIAKGIDNASAKVQKFASALLPVVYGLSDEIKGMPDMTIDDSVARAERLIRGMSEFKYKKQS